MYGLTGMGCGTMPNINSINSKAEALKFAIEFTATFSADGSSVNMEKAQELYDFICRNVELPDTPQKQWDSVVERINEISEMVQDYLRREIAIKTE